VSASGAWDATQQKAVLTWTASPDADLDHYSIRTAPGSRYRASEESVIGSAPVGTTTFATDVGLTAPEASAVFKVYVAVRTGNEKGSNVVKVTRPA
jgi:hypothetical protein